MYHNIHPEFKPKQTFFLSKSRSMHFYQEPEAGKISYQPRPWPHSLVTVNLFSNGILKNIKNSLKLHLCTKVYNILIKLQIYGNLANISSYDSVVIGI